MLYRRVKIYVDFMCVCVRRMEKFTYSKEARIISSRNFQAKHNISDVMALSPRVGDSFNSIRLYLFLDNALDTIDALAKTQGLSVHSK